MALAISGCGSGDDEDASAEASSSEGQDADSGKEADGDKSEEPEESEEPDAAGDDEGTGGADAETPAEEPGDAEAAGNGGFDGFWLTQSSGEKAAVLLVDDGQVLFSEDTTAEGDTCTGTIASGKLNVTCKQQGSKLWPDTEATVATAHSERNIDVTWASGTKQGYYKASEGIHSVNDNVRERPGLEEWLDQR